MHEECAAGNTGRRDPICYRDCLLETGLDVVDRTPHIAQCDRLIQALECVVIVVWVRRPALQPYQPMPFNAVHFESVPTVASPRPRRVIFSFSSRENLNKRVRIRCLAFAGTLRSL